ncbi:hypothetical protein A3C17_03615 [Candidatus Uhrbacteria bacterium RIFCSPHIGHO2_02_FULL_53_13]|uniref:Carbohydrate kinase PfkB domain-containing protein n=1 Tax=Candidatus Uhrbacteria bacterium RIFCSPHIGHO2_02_FULL_53_13 TaxID=1802389 RepID=A0A1F7TZJ5_9BACT|nr:MAG: hypothetical protein A3C17_03615 [Candidatus Uhrbacteria bacterium RIFCSPHIGHO2_02_FULL_53_13]
MRFDVLTIGAAVRDVYVHSNAFHVTDSSVVPGKKDACFVLGRKIEVDAPVFCTGGGATNAAATFGHLGLKVAPICKIGTDALASDVIRDLERHGVYTHALVRDAKTPTGYSVLLTAETGERTAIVYRGASANLAQGDLPKRLDTDWVYVTSVGGNLSLVKAIFARAHASGAKTAWNPGSRELQHGRKALAPLLSKTDVLFLNREEAVSLTKESRYDTRGILRAMKKAVRHTFVMSDGADGSYAVNNTHAFRAFPTDAPAVNATGAGDAFGSGVISGLIHWNGDLVNSLRLGSLNAESVIGKIGAKEGLLERLPGTRRLAAIRVEPYEI